MVEENENLECGTLEKDEQKQNFIEKVRKGSKHEEEKLNMSK